MIYKVKNWARYQHYSKRNPPWIKLHFSLLSSRDWVALDDASRVLAIACMLIASRNSGEVPADPEYMKRVAYLNKTPNFKPLIECGFLESASTMLADASGLLANVCSETETETETEESRKRPSKRAPKGFEPDREHALRECPDMDVDREIQKFRDYEFPRARSDWPATWRNWVSNSRDKGWYAKRGNGNGKSPYRPNDL